MEKNPFSMLTPAFGALRIKINAITSVLTDEQKAAMDAYIRSSVPEFVESAGLDEEGCKMLERFLE